MPHSPPAPAAAPAAAVLSAESATITKSNDNLVSSGKDSATGLQPSLEQQVESQNNDDNYNQNVPSSRRENKLIFAPSDPQYLAGKLDRNDLNDDPFLQFHIWFTQALTSNVYQPEATTLSTAKLPSGRVSARIVYLKELDHRGFVIYSNWSTSYKSLDISTNPWAALTFWFREQERQVRVEGLSERLSPEESQVYFDTRLRSSRIGAWASQQSKVLRDREELEERVKEVEKQFENQDKIPVPQFWGGLRVVPLMIEFWQGRHSRLHDRFRYERDSVDDNVWKVERLSP